MKKMGIMLAALVITMFFVGAVAAMPANNPPDQREKFREDCKVQGVGQILYDKTILDKEIAVDVEEYMIGNGSFAMTLTEILNEGVRLNCAGNCTNGMGLITDPIYGDAHSPVMTNFECNKMIQFESLDGITGLSGTATYSNPGFHGGMNAKVTENFGAAVWVEVWDGTAMVLVQQNPVRSLQKDEKVTMTTTATYNETPDTPKSRDWRNCNKAQPYTANELNFATKNAFIGAWETQSSWKKVCSKNVQHHQRFIGDFQVDKNLIFKEEVTKPCPEKEPHGDC